MRVIDITILMNNNILRICFVWSMLIVFSVNMLFASAEKLITEIELHYNDSVFRHLYLYDQEKRVILDTRSYRVDANWVRLDQTEWVYFDDMPDVQIGRKWNNGQWVDSYVIRQNRIGDLHTEEYYVGSVSTPNLKKTTIRRFEDGLLKSSVSRSVLNGNSFLIDSVMYEYELAKLSFETHYSKQPDGSLFVYRFDYEYNVVGDILSLTENVLLNDTLWQEKSQTQWYYKPGTTLVSSERSRNRNLMSGLWENSKMLLYRYDSSGRKKEEVYFYWNSMVWEKTLRYFYSFNDQGDLFGKDLSMPIYREWRNTVNVRYLPVVDADEQDIESVYGFWGGSTGEYVNSRIPFNFNGETRIVFAHKLKLIYSDYSSVTYSNNKDVLTVNVFPNPSSGIFYYNPSETEMESWTVYDVKGQIVKSQVNGALTGVVDLSDLPNAIYFLRANVGGRVLYSKLVKR